MASSDQKTQSPRLPQLKKIKERDIFFLVEEKDRFFFRVKQLTVGELGEDRTRLIGKQVGCNYYQYRVFQSSE